MAGLNGKNNLLKNGAQYNKMKQNIKRKTFYGPYEYVQLSHPLVLNRHNSLGRNNRIKDRLYNIDDLSPEYSLTSTQRVANQHIPSVSNAFQINTWSDQWNPVTHWTLQEYLPHDSYSYHYYNVKYPKRDGL